MTDGSKEAPVPRKLKDAIAIFETSEGQKPKKDNIQLPVATAGLSISQPGRGQNGSPWSKNAGIAVGLQATQPSSDHRSQLKKTVTEQCSDQTDFRAHLKPAKGTPKIALEPITSAGIKTNQAFTERGNVPERMAAGAHQGLGKVQITSLQEKANKDHGKDFKVNLAKVTSSQISSTQRTVFPTGQSLATTHSGRVPPTDTAHHPQPSALNWSAGIPKRPAIPLCVNPEPHVTQGQRKPLGMHLATPKPPLMASGSASNHSNATFVRTDSSGKSNSLPQKTTPISRQNPPDSKPTVANKPSAVPLPPMPKTGAHWKVSVIDRSESGSGNSGAWKSSSIQSNHSAQNIILSGGKRYRLLPPPTANRDACPRKPIRRLPSVDLAPFVRQAAGYSEILARVVARSAPPLPLTKSKFVSLDRPVSLIPEWTEEDEAREANLKAARQQAWVSEDDETYENSIDTFPNYVNAQHAQQNWGKQTEDHTRSGEEVTGRNSRTSEELYEEGCENIADATDDSDYENIDSYNQQT